MYFRSLKNAILCIALSIVFVVPAKAQQVSINFIANAALRITDGEHVLFTDFPYVSAAHGSMAYTYPYFVEQGNEVTTLITNRYADHFDPITFMTLDWKAIAPAEVVGDLQTRYRTANEARDLVVAELQRTLELDRAQDPDGEVTVVMPEPIIEPDTIIVEENLMHGPIQIQAIKTKYGVTEHYSYLLDWHGKKIYLSGETGETAHLADLPALDAAFLSPKLFENARKENMLPETKNLVIYQHQVAEIIPNCFDCIIPQQGALIPLD